MNELLSSLFDRNMKAEPSDEEYVGEDGLFYCKKCHTPTQCRVEFGGKTHVVSCMCQCRKEEEEKYQRELAEMNHRNYIYSLKANGIQERALYDWTFEKAANSPSIQMARRYVDSWPEVRKNNLGLLLWGDVGTGKSFTAACIANALLETGVPVLMTNFSKILNQYVTEGTFDAYLYQTLENKQRFISQIMTSKSPVRSCDDVDEQALSYAEIKALCAGNPLIREKMDLDVEVARLKVLKSDHQSQQYRLEDRLLKHFPQEIERTKVNIRGFEADIQTVEAHPLPMDKEQFVGLELRGQQFTDKLKAGEALLAACKAYHGTEPMHLGSYRGFQMELTYDTFRQEFDLTLKGAMSHRLSLGTDARGNLIRMDNALAGIPARLEKAQEQLTNLENQREAAQQELGKPFPQEAELREKSARLAELDAALNMDDSPAPAREDGDRDAASDTESRPSVLADLRSKAATLQPRKPGEQQHAEEVL